MAGLVLLTAGATPNAQVPVLLVGEDILVGREPAGRVLIEPHLAAHPSDPSHLLAVGWVFPEGTEARDPQTERCAVFLSSDGGRTWGRRELPGTSCQDPWVSLTHQRAVLTAMGTHPSLPDAADQLLAYVSSDGGRSWHEVPQSLGTDHDGPRSIAGSDGTVYVVSGQAWRDEAKNLRFSVPVGRMRPGSSHVESMHRLLPSNLNLNSDGLAMLSDGALVVTYDDFGRKVDGRWTPAGALKGRRSWAVISRDHGRSFSIPLFITESCYARPTSLAVDGSSGPFRDRLYHVCAGAEYRSILLNVSADRGEEWSTAMPIEAPTAAAETKKAPQVAVNAQGVVAIAWMDSRDDPSGRCSAPYLAASGDGGRTFSPAVRVASHVSCPDVTRIGFAARRWPVGGDYFGLTTAADGRFHVLWPDARSGTFELRTAAVTVRPPP